jgi:uncharacterized protein
LELIVRSLISVSLGGRDILRRETVIVDCHTHVMWYPDHLGEQYVDEALQSKLVKLKRSGGEVYTARLDKHSYDSKPEDHWNASASADKVVVFGLQAKASGVWVPNELIADYVRQHPEKLEGWASVDPNERDCVEQLEYCVSELGLKGLKIPEGLLELRRRRGEG